MLGSIQEGISKAHFVGLEVKDQKVEEILESDEYINRKCSSLQNMEFEMFSDLLSQNIKTTHQVFLTNDV